MSDERKRLEFEGKEFSKEPFTDEEWAQQRHRNYHYDHNFLPADKFLQETGLGWLSRMAKAAPGVIKTFGAISVVTGAIVALKAAGIL